MNPGNPLGIYQPGQGKPPETSETSEATAAQLARQQFLQQQSHNLLLLSRSLTVQTIMAMQAGELHELVLQQLHSDALSMAAVTKGEKE